MTAIQPLRFLTFPGGVLRPLMQTDAPIIYQWVNDPEVRMYLNRSFPETLENEQEWITSLGKRQEHNTVLGIEVMESETPCLIGTMGLHRINWINRTATTGTMLGDKRFWNRGIATAAKMALLRHAFFELNLRQIYSEVVAFNGRSARYAQKCGYRRYGRVPNDVFRDGRYYDRLQFVVTRDRFAHAWKDWCALHPTESLGETVARHAAMNQ